MGTRLYSFSNNTEVVLLILLANHLGKPELEKQRWDLLAPVPRLQYLQCFIQHRFWEPFKKAGCLPFFIPCSQALTYSGSEDLMLLSSTFG